MVIHSVSFSLYNIAIIVYYAELYVYDVNALSDPSEAIHNGLIAWSSVTYTTFISQLCLIWIFLQFRSKAEKEVTPQNFEDVKCSVVRMNSFDDEIAVKQEMYSKHSNSNTESF
jgi:hypothetical protein